MECSKHLSAKLLISLEHSEHGLRVAEEYLHDGADLLGWFRVAFDRLRDGLAIECDVFDIVVVVNNDLILLLLLCGDAHILNVL